MKHKKWLSSLTAFCLAVLLGCSGIGCFVSAFAPETVRMGTVFLWCVGMALCWSVCYPWKLQLLPMGILAFLTGYLWYRGSLEQSVEALLYQISSYYDSAYHCGVLCWSGTFPADGDVTLALCGIVTLITLPVCRAICKSRSVWLAVVATLLPLAVCMVVIDLLPSRLWLGILLTGEVLLILPNLLRRSDPKQGTALTALAVLPTALAVMLLFSAVPREDYRGQSRADAVADTLLQWLPSAERVEDAVGSAISGVIETDSVDLSAIGRRNNARIIVMRVSGTASGTVYLRGQHLDSYDGTSWYNSGMEEQTPWMPEGQLLESAGTLQITTRYTMPTVYVPYYAAEPGQTWNGHRIENTDKQKTYDYAYKRLVADWKSRQEAGVDTAAQSGTALPTQTRIWAEALLESIVSQDQRITEKAEAIAGFVRSSAKYNTDIGTMPGRETDFVRWFLEDCDEGYCVHFASSAVVLLRAAGIPARYVTGYMTTLDSDGQATVRLDDAHAWAEYYVDGVGWVILEATPATESTVQQPQTQTETTTQPHVDITTTQPVPSQSVPAQTLPVEPDAPPAVQPPKNTDWLQNGLKALGITVLIVVLAWLQRRLRFAIRLRRLCRGPANTRAIAMWREIAYLSRLLSEQPQGDLFVIAQKAKFSQHTLTLEELKPMDSYIQQARMRLRRKPLYLRLIYQIILAVC